MGLGGKWEPIDCRPKQNIAIIIPYRDRVESLKLFVKNMYPFLMRQNARFGIYLIEPLAKLPFNRGTLINIGFLESQNDSRNLWDCFFFHDIDMIAVDDRNIYECNPMLPVHYAVALRRFDKDQ
jgi:beta-1,4-galactosyltransferase 2